MTLKTRYTRVTFQLTPMQFSDSDEEVEHDGHALFSRGRHLLGGTEAGGGKRNHISEILSELADFYDYKWFHHGDSWGAVSKSMIVPGSWSTHNTPAIESSEGVGPHGDRGIAGASWDTKHLGHMTLGVAHLLTNGRGPSDPNYELNEKYNRIIGRWGEKYSKGRSLSFIMADMNRARNAFSEAPFTSFQDLLNKNEGTGHGPIDDIAKCDFDNRVEPVYVDSLPDKELRLFTDHYLTEGIAKIRWIS